MRTSLLCVWRRHELATGETFEDDLHDSSRLIVELALDLHRRQKPVGILLLVLVGFDLFQILQGLCTTFDADRDQSRRHFALRCRCRYIYRDHIQVIL